MGADCYLCELSYDAIPEHSKGDAVGACKLCGVLACLAHGQRDANRPAFVCGCCLPNLLAAAAVKQLGGGDSPPQTSPDDHEPPPDTPSDFSQWALNISNVDDVIGDFADDRWAWLHEDIKFLSTLLVDQTMPAALRGFAQPDAGRARALMAAAAAIAIKLSLPSHEMIPVLQHVAQAVKRYA
jgi:hypothetical protein